MNNLTALSCGLTPTGFQWLQSCSLRAVSSRLLCAVLTIQVASYRWSVHQRRFVIIAFCSCSLTQEERKRSIDVFTWTQRPRGCFTSALCLPEDLNLPAVNCLCSCLFGDVFISSSFLSSFGGYGVLGVTVFSFNTWTVMSLLPRLQGSRREDCCPSFRERSLYILSWVFLCFQDALSSLSCCELKPVQSGTRPSAAGALLSCLLVEVVSL